MNDQPMFDLTAMTGKEASSQRTAVIASFELPYRALIIGMIAFVVGLFPAALVWLLLGAWAIVFEVAFVLAAVWMFHGRTRNGLELRHYTDLLNRQRAVLNTFMFGAAVVEVPHDDWSVVKRGNRPNPARQVLPEEMSPRDRTPEQDTVATVESIFRD
jgi:hypothetical protein